MSLIIIQILIFVSFPLYIVWTEGEVLSSISAGSYRLEPNRRYWFLIWLGSLAISMYWHLDVLGFFAFLSAIGFGITGTTPEHKRDSHSNEDELHLIGTVIAISSIFLGFLVLHWLWLPVLIFGVVSGLLAWRAANAIWWIEFVAMACSAWGLFTL